MKKKRFIFSGTAQELKDYLDKARSMLCGNHTTTSNNSDNGSDLRDTKIAPH